MFSDILFTFSGCVLMVVVIALIETTVRRIHLHKKEEISYKAVQEHKYKIIENISRDTFKKKLIDYKFEREIEHIRKMGELRSKIEKESMDNVKIKIKEMGGTPINLGDMLDKFFGSSEKQGEEF